jgi:murein L,D-transpeptidase YafK
MSLNVSRVLAAGATALLLAGCNGETTRFPARAYAPIPPDTLSLFASKNTNRNAPVLIRAYKQESEIEVWKQAADGRYVHVKTYPVCRWSGQLGPKKKEGDRQVPEGFYTVTASQMNPNSAYWLSFNVGYPNAMERAMGRNGGDIMVHGTCSSRGCFAMTNEQIEEIYAVMREAFNGGQKAVQFQSYPFRMTPANLAKFRHDPNMPFWKNLKEGSDHFEVARAEPRVGYCGGKYVYNGTIESGRMDPLAPCPKIRVDDEIASAVAQKQHQDDEKVAELVQKGTPAVRVQYADGSQHMSFRAGRFAMASSSTDDRFAAATVNQAKLASLGDVSRPEAVDSVEEFAVDERGQRKDTKVEVAKAEPAKPAAAKPVTLAGKPVPAEPSSAVTALAPAPAPSGSFSALGALFGTAPAQPAPAVATSASSDKPAGAQPFYKRWFGSSEEAPVADDPATPQPAKVPLPPRRQAKAPDGKPQQQSQVKTAPQRQASLDMSGALAGSQPVLGQGFARAQ